MKIILRKAIARLEEIITDRPKNYCAWERVLLLYSETKNWDKLLARGKECAQNLTHLILAKILFANAQWKKRNCEWQRMS